MKVGNTVFTEFSFEEAKKIIVANNLITGNEFDQWEQDAYKDYEENACYYDEDGYNIPYKILNKCVSISTIDDKVSAIEFMFLYKGYDPDCDEWGFMMHFVGHEEECYGEPIDLEILNKV